MLFNLITYLIIIAWVFSQAYIDYEHFKRNQFFKDHTSRLVSRALVGVIAFALDPITGIQVALLFWSLFDFMLNKLRGFDWDYRGTEANSDKINKDVWIASKLTTAVLSLILLLV